MKKFIAALVLFTAFVGYGAIWERPTGPIDVLWQGETDVEMLNQIRHDVTAAQQAGRPLRAHLVTPGGPVVLCLEMARLIRNASDNGTVVEIHGEGLVASCGTFVLASGTPGHRYISQTALFLVHPMKSGGMFQEPTCLAPVADPKTEDEKVVNELYLNAWRTYARMTGRSLADVKSWMSCGNETVGADMAVAMGIADKVEK